MKRSFVLQTPNNYHVPRTLLVQEVCSDTVKSVGRPIIRNSPCANALSASLGDVSIHEGGREGIWRGAEDLQNKLRPELVNS